MYTHKSIWLFSLVNLAVSVSLSDQPEELRGKRVRNVPSPTLATLLPLNRKWHTEEETVPSVGLTHLGGRD